jgi:hypothetical protein
VNDEIIPELSWCPECQSPPTSDYAHVLYCDMHRPVSIPGVLDRVIIDGGEYIFQGEGGDGNSALLDFLHRGKKETNNA